MATSIIELISSIANRATPDQASNTWKCVLGVTDSVTPSLNIRVIYENRKKILIIDIFIFNVLDFGEVNPSNGDKDLKNFSFNENYNIKNT